MILASVINSDVEALIFDNSNKRNILTMANGNALLWCMSPGGGKVIIVDVFKQRLEGIKFCVEKAFEVKNFTDWSSQIETKFPEAYDTLKDFITDSRYKNLTDRENGQLFFLDIDLSLSKAYKSILEFLKEDGPRAFIDLLDMNNVQADMRNHLTALDLLKQDQDQRMEDFKNNLLELMKEDSTIILDADMKPFSKSELSERDMKKISDINQDINAEKDSEALSYLSLNLFEEINHMITDGSISSDYLPMMADVQMDGNIGKWKVGFINKSAPYLDIISRNVKLRNRFFPEFNEILKEKSRKISHYLKKEEKDQLKKPLLYIQSYSYVNSLYSSIKKGYPDTSNIDNKTLARMVEVQFYTDLGQFLEAPVQELLQRKVVQVKGFKSFFKDPKAWPRVGMGFTMIAGLVLDVYNLAVNIYILFRLEEEQQALRSALIASISLGIMSAILGFFSLSTWSLYVLGYVSLATVNIVTKFIGLSAFLLFSISIIILEG